MRILNQNDIELNESEIDKQKGYVQQESIFIQHHEAVEAAEKVSHYEVTKVYPNGGQEVKEVIDVEATEAAEAWDEYETILRYILYTEEELEERKKAEEEAYFGSAEYRIATLEAALELLLSGATE